MIKGLRLCCNLTDRKARRYAAECSRKALFIYFRTALFYLRSSTHCSFMSNDVYTSCSPQQIVTRRQNNGASLLFDAPSNSRISDLAHMLTTNNPFAHLSVCASAQILFCSIGLSSCPRLYWLRIQINLFDADNLDYLKWSDCSNGLAQPELSPLMASLASHPWPLWPLCFKMKII